MSFPETYNAANFFGDGFLGLVLLSDGEDLVIQGLSVLLLLSLLLLSFVIFFVVHLDFLCS